jgi:hypothetical protein
MVAQGAALLASRRIEICRSAYENVIKIFIGLWDL